MRFRLGAGEESRRYRPGQFVSAEYAARYPHKVVAEQPKPEPEPEALELYGELYGDEWEMTVYYEP